MEIGSNNFGIVGSRPGLAITIHVACFMALGKCWYLNNAVKS